MIGGKFARTEPWNNAVSYTRGLISDEERKNSWTLSERSGQGAPDGMQRLLSTTDCDPDKVRDALVEYVKKHLGDSERILAIDETGFLKKGTASAGVPRQYSGTSGRVENYQIGVFLSYAATAGVHSWIVSCTCPRPGWTTLAVASGRAPGRTSHRHHAGARRGHE